MAQCRVTAKMAKKLKLGNLLLPEKRVEGFYDDWCIDLTRIMRKEVIVFMHVDTRLALAMPVYEIGGIANMLDCFSILLKHLLYRLDFDKYERLVSDMTIFFEKLKTNPRFCKTDNRSVMTHMSQFKLVLDYKAAALNRIDQQVCDEVSDYWLESMITYPSNSDDYTSPIELWEQCFKEESGVLG